MDLKDLVTKVIESDNAHAIKSMDDALVLIHDGCMKVLDADEIMVLFSLSLKIRPLE